MRILTLAPETKTRTRAVLEDGRSLVFSNRELSGYGFREGDEIPDDAWEEVLAAQRKLCLQKCGSLLADADYSEKALLDKLLRAGFLEETARACVSAMVDAHYVDDERFARSYLSRHLSDRSLKRIRFDLEGKGVSETAIDRAFSEVSEEEDFGSAELEQAIRLLEKRRFPFGEADYARRTKEAAYLDGKGHQGEVIRKALEGRRGES